MSDSIEIGGGFGEFVWHQQQLKWELLFDWMGQDVVVCGKSKDKARAVKAAITAMEDLRTLIGITIDDLADLETEVEG